MESLRKAGRGEFLSENIERNSWESPVGFGVYKYP
jgi:hypothetical protein